MNCFIRHSTKEICYLCKVFMILFSLFSPALSFLTLGIWFQTASLLIWMSLSLFYFYMNTIIMNCSMLKNFHINVVQLLPMISQLKINSNWILILWASDEFEVLYWIYNFLGLFYLLFMIMICIVKVCSAFVGDFSQWNFYAPVMFHLKVEYILLSN